MAQCTAKARSGKRCAQPAIRGGFVCRYHGGGAPQVKQKAAERLAALVDPAITTLGLLLRSKQEHVRLKAVQDVLDRNGHKPPDQHRFGGLAGAPISVAPDLSKLSDHQLTTLDQIARAVFGGEMPAPATTPTDILEPAKEPLPHAASQKSSGPHSDK